MVYFLLYQICQLSAMAIGCTTIFFFSNSFIFVTFLELKMTHHVICNSYFYFFYLSYLYKNNEKCIWRLGICENVFAILQHICSFLANTISVSIISYFNFTSAIKCQVTIKTDVFCSYKIEQL